MPTSIDEHRALAADQARHDHQVTDDERAALLPEISRYIATLLTDIDGWEQLEPADPGACDDCGEEGSRWVLGSYRVCHTDALKRLQARDKAAAPIEPLPQPLPIFVPAPPRERDDLPQPKAA